MSTGVLVLAKPGDASCLVVVDGDKIRVFNLSTGGFVQPEFVAPTAEQQARENARNLDEDEDEIEPAEGEEKPAQPTSGQPAPSEGSRQIMHAAFSNSGDHFVAIDDMKTMTVFCTKTWKCINTRFVPKRCVSLAFSNDDTAILVADKSGDVTSLPVANASAAPSLCLGVISMLLDVVMDVRNKVVITADRDEKIRISHFPNAYNIQSYCLGHTEMVTAVALVPTQPDLLVSGAADGTVRTWRHMEGTPLAIESITLDAGTAGKSEKASDAVEIVASIACSPANGDVAVVLESRTIVLVFALSGDGKLELRSKIDLGATASSATFTADGVLVTAAATDSTPIRAFQIQDGQYVPLETGAVGAVNKSASFAETRGERPLMRDYLKRAQDLGIVAYQQRKEIRVAGERERKEKNAAKKRGAGAELAAGADEKRQKADDDN